MPLADQEPPPPSIWAGVPWGLIGGIVAMAVALLGGGWLIGTSNLFANPGALAVLPLTNADGTIARGAPVEGLATLFAMDLAAAAEIAVVFHNAPGDGPGDASGPKALAALRQSLREDDRTRFILDGTAAVAGKEVRLRFRITDLRTGAEIWSGNVAGTGQALFPAMADTIRRANLLIRRNADFQHGRQPPPEKVADRLARTLTAAAAWFPVEPSPRPWANVTRMLELAADLDPTDPFIVGRLAARQTFAWLHGFPGDNETLDRIADLVARAAAIDPRHVEFLTASCLLQRARSQFDEAVELCRLALGAEPKRARAAIEIGHDELERWRPEEALAWYRRAAELEADDAERWSMLRGMAMAYYLLGDHERAVFTMEQAAAIRRDDPVARGWLAALLALGGRVEDARREANAFFALPADAGRKPGVLPRIHLLAPEYDGRFSLISTTLDRFRPRSPGRP